MSQLVEVGRGDNLLQAQQLLDVLTDAGVDAQMFDSNMGTLYPQVGAIGVRVMVRDSDVARARAALAEAQHLPRGPHADLPDDGPKQA